MSEYTGYYFLIIGLTGLGLGYLGGWRLRGSFNTVYKQKDSTKNKHDGHNLEEL